MIQLKRINWFNMCSKSKANFVVSIAPIYFVETKRKRRTIAVRVVLFSTKYCLFSIKPGNVVLVLRCEFWITTLTIVIKCILL